MFGLRELSIKSSKEVSSLLSYTMNLEESFSYESLQKSRSGSGFPINFSKHSPL